MFACRVKCTPEIETVSYAFSSASATAVDARAGMASSTALSTSSEIIKKIIEVYTPAHAASPGWPAHL